MNKSILIEPVAKDQRKSIHILFEKIPAILFFGILIFLLLGGVFFPVATAYLIILINVYFFYKSGMLLVTFTLAYVRILKAEATDWQAKLVELQDPQASVQLYKQEIKLLKELQFQPGMFKDRNHIGRKNIDRNDTDRLSVLAARLPDFLQRILFAREKRKSVHYLTTQIDKLERLDINYYWQDIQQIVIVPHVKEPEHILRETLDNLSKQTFPTKQLNIVLAAEARDPNGLPLSLKLAEEYKDVFNNVWVSNHILQDDEIVGKSSNMKAGGKVAFDQVIKLGWDLKKTLVTSCDADSKLPVQYFSYITYEYITRQDAEFKIFNATLVFYNNIWRLPFYARIKNSMSTIFNTSRLPRVDKLIPFSTYTTSFWMIEQIGFWTPWVTPEDFHLFFKAQFKFGGIVSVVPIYLRIMSDAAEGVGHIDTIKNNYNQERRWQWGISDDGWVLQNVLFNIGKQDLVTVYRALHSVFDHVLGPITGVMLIVGGNIPPLLNPAFSATVLGSQLPQVSSTIITLSLGFMLIIILLDLTYRPKRNTNWWLPFNLLREIMEWLILPVASFVLAVLPGLEANTRLLFGKHLEYYVTKKH